MKRLLSIMAICALLCGCSEKADSQQSAEVQPEAAAITTAAKVTDIPAEVQPEAAAITTAAKVTDIPDEGSSADFYSMADFTGSGYYKGFADRGGILYEPVCDAERFSFKYINVELYDDAYTLCLYDNDKQCDIVYYIRYNMDKPLSELGLGEVSAAVSGINSYEVYLTTYRFNNRDRYELYFSPAEGICARLWVGTEVSTTDDLLSTFSEVLLAPVTVE